MPHLLFWIVAFTALGGVLSVLAAASMLLVPERSRQRLLTPLVSFAIGALLGAAFLALLPHALEGVPGVSVDAHDIGLAVLLGIFVFFGLEKMVIWRHCHSHDCEMHAHDVAHAQRIAAGKLILIGDAIHNMVDGVLIAAAFMTDVRLGVVTSIAVIAHEIPQEVGDFAILLHSGYTRKKALVYNVLVSLTTVVGGVVAYFSLQWIYSIVPYVLAVAAASFIYIATADLIPGLHRRPQPAATLSQLILITLGVLVIYLTESAMH